MNQLIIRLDRSFSEITSDNTNITDDISQPFSVFSGGTKWSDLEKEYRVVILADAGAGKTVEMRSRAELIQQSGRLAFFIRIEDLVEEDFSWALEVGSSEEFTHWLVAAEEAWFFLDSVDEARLISPNIFEKAIRRFANKIKTCTHRAHIYITGRPYSWRFTTDRELIENYLPFSGENKDNLEIINNSLRIYSLNALTSDEIHFYAEKRCIKDANNFVGEIERANLTAMASRPFDLDFLIANWRNDGKLGSRYEVFERTVAQRLDEINPSRRHSQPLNAAKALRGASLLAGAVTLTGKRGIKSNDNNTDQNSVDALVVLSNWEPTKIWALLERGVFNDAIYNMVGFRHREMRDFLTAKWINYLLSEGHSRRMVESLIFREMYGEQVISPRLISIMPWLILMDDQIRDRALKIQPEISLNGGDVSHLPLSVRVKILNRIAQRIASNTDDYNSRYNSSISLIAKEDLVKTISTLIDKYYYNDEVIYFLCRLLWQSNLPAGQEKMFSVATDCNKGIYTRISAIRAFMTTASNEKKLSLWSRLNDTLAIFPLRILAEIIKETIFNASSVDYLLTSLSKSEHYDRFDTSGLTEAFTIFIDKSSQQQHVDYEIALTMLIKGIYTLLKKPPFLESPNIGVSNTHVCLIPFSVEAIERLVSIKSEAVFENHTLDLLLAFVQTRYWHKELIREYKGALSDLIPEWPEINDALFWRAIENLRAESQFITKRIINDGNVQWQGHFFKFSEKDFTRVLKHVKNREFLDDKLVALSLALRLYSQSDNNETLLKDIINVSQSHHELEQSVEQFLTPPPNPEMEAINKKIEEDRRHSKELRARHERDYNNFVQDIKAHPEEIRFPSKVNAGEITNGQYFLYNQLSKSKNYLARDFDWHELTEAFGSEVATAFRDAAISHWRNFKPSSPLESIPLNLIFGLLGIEFESKERVDFPFYFSEIEVDLALLYSTREINGFPSWLEKMYFAFPEKVIATLWQNVRSELAKTVKENTVNQVFHYIVHQAPWSHAGLTKNIYEWLKENDPCRINDLLNCIQLLISGDISKSKLADLAILKIKTNNLSDNLPIWFALYVDTQPNKAIPALKNRLRSMTKDTSCVFAQRFLTTLTGKTRSESGHVSLTGMFRNPSTLKSLYSLMMKYIRPQDDIDRSGGVVYSPTLRDNAQGARELLFQWLAEIPGKETYISLLELIDEFSDKDNNQWMARAARNRAIADADLELWKDEQVRDFDANLTIIPQTPRQLYDIGVHYLLDFKDKLERGNTSLAETYKRVTSETEMRNIVVSHIMDAAKNAFTCSQESELANKQRPDIWLQHPTVSVPVPIELKLLEKNWSGPKICERLRNQLVGDYLRENNADFGIFLLIWQGMDGKQKTWMINGKMTRISELENALTMYWLSISNRYPKISDIKIIVIDLSLREKKSSD